MACPSKYLSSQRTGYLVPRSLLGLSALAVTLEVFRCEPGRPRFHATDRPSTDLAPLQRLSRLLASVLRSEDRRVSASSLEVLRPFSVFDAPESTCSLRSCPVSTPNVVPPRPFSGPRGVDPRARSQPCFVLLTLMGFCPSGSSPPYYFQSARHRLVPSRRFSRLRPSRRNASSVLEPRPQG